MSIKDGKVYYFDHGSEDNKPCSIPIEYPKLVAGLARNLGIDIPSQFDSTYTGIRCLDSTSKAFKWVVFTI